MANRRYHSLWKIGLDLVLTVLFLVALGFHVTGGRGHEWVGLAWCVLVVFHCVWNRGWFVSVFKGKYTPRRGLSNVVTVLLGLGLLAIGVSGAMNSIHVFGFLGLDGGVWARKVHSFAVYWSFLLVGVHVGLHWPKISSSLKRALGQRDGFLVAPVASRVVAAALALLGAWAFIDREMWAKLFFGASFDYWDSSRPVVLFFAANFAILVAGVVVTRGACVIAKRVFGENRSVDHRASSPAEEFSAP